MSNNDKHTDASNAANAAETVRAALADSLTAAKRAGVAVLVKRYGEGADTASITLAQRAAAVNAGGDKPRGGSAQRINDTLKLVTPDSTPADYAKAARVVLDKHKADAKAHRESVAAERAAARDVLNDRGRSKADRIAALEVMTAIDAAADNSKAAALADRVRSALIAARDGGQSILWALSIVDEVYPGYTLEVADATDDTPAGIVIPTPADVAALATR